MKALNIAKYILTKCTKDEQPISNLQLQKMLYYIQYDFLKRNDSPLFDDDFEAWKCSPVIPNVYFEYSRFGAFKISADYDDYNSILENMSQNDKECLNKIIEDKRDINAWKLVSYTHGKSKAWDIAFKDGEGIYSIISKESIKKNAF